MEGEDVLLKKFIEVANDVGLVTSKSEATRLIKNNGAYLNNHRIEDPNYVIEEKDLIEQKYVLLGSGKKKKILIIIQ